MVATAALSVNSLSILGVEASPETWRRLLLTARDRGLRVYDRDGGAYAVTSRSHPGTLYLVDDHGCSCPAGQRRLACSHLAATISVRVRRGELVECASCGRFILREQAHVEWCHVGGGGDRLETFCGPNVGHQLDGLAERRRFVSRQEMAA